VVQNGHHGIRLLTADANFEPIRLNAKASGGERVLNSFDDIVAFILMRVKIRFRELPWRQAVREDFPRQKETHAAMRAAFLAREMAGRVTRERD
jgi:hypothetical protein